MGKRKNVEPCRPLLTYAVLFTAMVGVLLPLLPLLSGADELSDDAGRMEMAFFYDPECPCNEEIITDILPSLEENFTSLDIKQYDVTGESNRTLSDAFLEAYNVPVEESTDFPFFFIGDHYLSYETITYVSVARIITRYGNLSIPLWPQWNVTWSTEISLFFNSSADYVTLSGLTPIEVIDSLDGDHIRLNIYDLHDSPFNRSLLSSYRREYGVPDAEMNAVIFVGNLSDYLLDDNITPDGLGSTLAKYSGKNTRLRSVELPDDGVERDDSICIVIFYSPTCIECTEAKRFIEEMKASYPRLNITGYNTANIDYLKKQQEYYEFYDVPYGKRGSLGVFVGKDDYFTDDDVLKRDLRKVIDRYPDGCECPDINATEDIDVPPNFWFPVIIAGIIDGINPCAFVTLIFFTSYLLIRKRSKRQILMVGFSFTFAVFLSYFLMGIGLYKMLYYLSGISYISALMYPVTGIIALIFGIYSIWDYIKVKRGKEKEMVLQLPDSIKKITRRVIRSHMKAKNLVFISFFTGVLISFLEFMCTGQVYLPTIILIIAVKGDAVGYLYLLVYNLMFIWPLVLVFMAVYFGTTSKKLVALFQKRLGLMKILMAFLFFLLAALMFSLTVNPI